MKQPTDEKDDYNIRLRHPDGSDPGNGRARHREKRRAADSSGFHATIAIALGGEDAVKACIIRLGDRIKNYHAGPFPVRPE